MEDEPLTIAMAPCPDARAEGIVPGNSALEIEPQDLAAERGGVLGLVGVAGVTRCEVQHPVGADDDARPVVDEVARNPLQQNLLVVECRSVPVQADESIPQSARSAVRVHRVNPGLARKVWMERDAHQPTLAARGDAGYFAERGATAGLRIDARDAP